MKRTTTPQQRLPSKKSKTEATFHDPQTGETLNISAQLPTDLSGVQIENALVEASDAMDLEKENLSAQGKAIVDDAQALIENTHKHELFQKLFTFARKAQNLPSDDLLMAGRNLVDRVTGLASSLQTDAEDVAGYIRGTLYNFLTSADYRDLAADFYTIAKLLAAQIEDEFEEFDATRTSNKPRGASRPWNKPLNLAESVDSQPPKQMALERTTERSEALKAKTKELEEKSVEVIQERLNDFLSRLAGKKEYQSLVENFFKYSDQVTDILLDVTEDAKRTPEAKAARELLDQSYDILADFAGKKAVEKYRQDLVEIFKQFKDDKDLKKWRDATRDYILDSLRHPEVEDPQKAVEKLQSMIREGRRVLQKYRNNIEIIYEDQLKIAKSIRNDPALLEFQRNLTNLGSHLALNSSGQFDASVLQESIFQISNLMAGLFRNYLVTLPISKVELHSDEYDIVLRDIKVKGSGFAPDRIEVDTKSHSILHFVEGGTNKSSFQVTFRVANICPNFEDFYFEFEKKSFPAYQDSGRATIATDDSGLSIRASMLIKSQSDRPPKAVLQDLAVSLGFISIQTDAETHSILTPLLAPLFAESVRERIESLIYHSLHGRLDDGIDQVNDFFASNPIRQVTQQVASKIQTTATLSSDSTPATYPKKMKVEA